MNELKKKMAEFCWGKENIESHQDGKFLYYRTRWIEEDEEWAIEVVPDFPHDLNACFKWLVPQALEMIIEKGYVPPIMKLFQLWYDELVSLTGDSSNVQQAALALCKAIEKLIDGGK